MRSLVLAAGLGTRLRPITDIVPKPLVSVFNRPLLDIALSQLRDFGFGPFALNAFHLPETIEAYADQKRLSGMDVTVSVEAPEILGTGGPLKSLERWFQGERFLVYNGDILSSINFNALKQTHLRVSPLVTMSVRPGHNGKDRALWLEKSGRDFRVVAISKDRPAGFLGDPYTFACAYVAEAKLLDFIPAGTPYDVIAAFQAALKSGEELLAEPFHGFWADVGNPLSLWETTRDIHAIPSFERAKLLAARESEVFYRDPLADISRDFKESGFVTVGAGAQIAAGCELTDAVVLPKAQVSPGTKAEKAILGPGSIFIQL